MRGKLLVCLVFLLLGAIAGCGSTKDLAEAGEAVTRFHTQLDAEQFDAIYSQADQRFRDTTSQADFLAFTNAIHRKLGKVVDAKRNSYFVNFTTSGTQVRLNYATKFAGGDAQEEFVWVQGSQGFVLLGYHINSMALITK